MSLVETIKDGTQRLEANFSQGVAQEGLGGRLLTFGRAQSDSDQQQFGYDRLQEKVILKIISGDESEALEQNAKEFGLTLFGVKDKRQGACCWSLLDEYCLKAIPSGIVHIIGPEQGFTLPGSICVCGDSHTSSQ